MRLLDSANPRETFKVFEKKLSESKCIKVAETKCERGHCFNTFICKIACGLFNIMAKNIAAYKNDEIHHSIKRKGCDPKSSSAAQKILKLN